MGAGVGVVLFVSVGKVGAESGKDGNEGGSRVSMYVSWSR